MNEALVKIRNNTEQFFYKNIVKRIFFRIDPENVHDHIMKTGKFLGRNYITKRLTKSLFYYKHPMLEQQIQGIAFKNPIGLAAGFDKNAELTDILPAIGFGFIEVGSITGKPCEGNPKPRLWRLKNSKALVVYYGLKNDGCKAISQRLREKKFEIPVGISIAKTNNKETISVEAGIKDYVEAYKEFLNIGAYITINISCPNTFGGEPFTDAKKLDQLLTEIDKLPHKKPIFLKISPDLTEKQINALVEVCNKHSIQGFICSNLTKNRKNSKICDMNVPEKGGISGKVAEELANNLIRYVYQKTKGDYIIIGCGGVFTGEDAYKKIKAGASLIQLITGMIFEGPQTIGAINQELVKLLEKDGYQNIHEAVGADYGNKNNPKKSAA
ncbi:quinone-dependent dihydroorotate dehydrogenase [Candidatus Woesearchaeota archaeon]|nr:quinone-dependent dihydroorotate dehydrogenase [Candidatus Woesearchaeota archaeon]